MAKLTPAEIIPPLQLQLHRKLYLSYDAHGILIQPESSSPLHIGWNGTMSQTEEQPPKGHSHALVAEGIVGLLSGMNESVLICILSSVQVADSIRSIDSLLAIPLTPEWAKGVIDAEVARQRVTLLSNEEEGTEEEEEDEEETIEIMQGEAKAVKDQLSAVNAETTQPTSASRMDSKLIKETLKRLRGTYFSYSIDITRSLQRKEEHPLVHLPLWRRSDRRFFFNAHLQSPLIQNGLHSYIIVLMEGFVGHNSATLDSLVLDFTIISRRSVQRAGLRFQRRGTDSAGHVANFVETEFIIAATVQDEAHVSSFVQTRGSIPVYFSQSPWSLKPPPRLDRSSVESLAAATLHFDAQIELYGRQVIVNLAEAKGPESIVVDAYRQAVTDMNKSREEGKCQVRYVEFDFHSECKGMKYENISSRLLPQLESDLDELRSWWSSDGTVLSKQTGVVRTNCMDCLDRTNVVQSAIHHSVLNRHLVNLGVVPHETSTSVDMDRVTMALWADNGDAISRLYAGSSALKSDFVRSGKRNYRGVFNDGVSSISRLLKNTTNDFLSQAVIDYILGINLSALAEFSTSSESSDPSEILRLSTLRTEAIADSARIVIADDEKMINGWTLLSKNKHDVEEKIILLSKAAIYVCGFEYDLMKVVDFVRIPLGDIIGFQQGVYVLSALDSASRDPSQNFGLIIKYNSASSTRRINSYSMRVKPSLTESKLLPLNLSSLIPSLPSSETSTIESLAFKALRPDRIQLSSLSSNSQSRLFSAPPLDARTAKDVVGEILEAITRECSHVRLVKGWIVEEDIISESEARASTTILSKVTNGLKHLIW